MPRSNQKSVHIKESVDV